MNLVFGDSSHLEGGSARVMVKGWVMLGAALTRLAGCYQEESTVPRDVCGFRSVPGVLPGGVVPERSK